ncbi:TonB-dependent receptor [Vibrio cholerae]|uniref:TonB-dependent receptor domain-containing protein n=1 Tax=Vibrio cholerae TaxID=666 RepID=UPI000B48EBC2|nr:TonB-dependent receptor [Vibrio cholerae]EGR2467318.1 TonB-dependent receptor [Vibrio cholerae]ELY5178698.1 TonB-dependent receptor [Vibrio cholerae]KAA1206231.1 TonB-dependent receptor [Vibrio cholerae]MVB88016.1 TonB-dependent receptor [Vibrio cholerae]MVC74644.1 TonB-dependent receptor [Vibrio cholerae]
MVHNTRFKFSVLATFIGSQFLAYSAQANQQETMVVVSDQSLRVGQTIDSTQLEHQQANELSDVFRTAPEVQVGGGSAVSQKIYLRGIEDNMLNITIDGAVQAANVYHHQGRLSIEPELLKSVKVQPGVVRATDGAGALGGSIAFETKNPQDLLNANQRAGAQFKAGYYSNTQGYKTSATGYAQATDSLSMLASVTVGELDDFVDGKGQTQPHTGSENKAGLFKAVAELNQEQQLVFGYEARRDQAYRYHRPQWQPSAKNAPINQEMARDTFTSKYNYTPVDNHWVDTQVTLYLTETSLEHLQGPWGDYLGEGESVGADVRNTSRFQNFAVTYGADYREDEGRLMSPTYGSEKDQGKVHGIYAQADWSFDSQWRLTAGARYDKYQLEESKGSELNHSGVSPNATLTYQPMPSLSLYAGMGQAIRGATVRELFKLDGTKSSPDRKEEKAITQEIGLNWLQDNWMFTAKLFDMEIEDVVAEKQTRPRQLTNVGTLENHGGTATLGYQWHELNTRLTYSHARPELNGKPLNDDTKGIGTAIGDTWLLTLDYQVSDQWLLGYGGRYVARLTEVAAGYDEKPGYALHDLYAQWNPMTDEPLTLSLSIKNLFDKAYRDHASYGVSNDVATGTLEAGRDIRFNLAYQF